MTQILIVAFSGLALTAVAAAFAIWHSNRILAEACQELENFIWDSEVAKFVISTTVTTDEMDHKAEDDVSSIRLIG